MSSGGVVDSPTAPPPPSPCPAAFPVRPTARERSDWTHGLPWAKRRLRSLFNLDAPFAVVNGSIILEATKEGRVTKGEFAGRTIQEAVRLLRARGLHLVEVQGRASSMTWWFDKA